MNLPEIEKKIIKFWDKEKIFDKSVKLRRNKPFFSFYDGPPFASGLPHYGHILASAIKDTVLRYWAMKGRRILWRVGWDCHGLPVENYVEKKFGLKNKKEIEKFGIGRFNQESRKSVFLCINDWHKTLSRVGRWANYSNSYATMDNSYIESVWWVFKQLWEQGLVYQDFRVTPYCPRCGTPLSNFELNQPGAYQEVEDESIFVKFKLKSQKATYLLVWTTTPWTLAANTAIAVGSKETYVKIKREGEYLILAKQRLSVVDGYRLIEEFAGQDLVGLEYQPLYPMELDKPAYRVVPADFVSVEEGTGLVHIAPTFGEEDMELGQKQDLPGIITVDQEGKVVGGLGLPGQGKFIKEADADFKADLRRRQLLFKEEKIRHAYPFCWRCDSPLLYYPINSWYVAVSRFRKELVENNKKIRWVPAHIKKGRFGKWLEGARDWSVSRNRYWGAPIPAWQCPDCGKNQAIGSLDELSTKAKRNNYYVLRHGQTWNNLARLIYTDQENQKTSLTPAGRKKIESLLPEIKRKKIDLIFHSPFLRTKQTAEIISRQLGVKMAADNRLKDTDVGIFKGKPVKDYQAYFNNDQLKRFEQRPFLGESLKQVRKRMMGFLLSVDKKYQGKNILIVSHGDPLWILKGAAQGLAKEKIAAVKAELFPSPGQFNRLNFKNLPFDIQGRLDLHRPFIDRIELPCSCGGKMKRTLEVFDCWFESGSMPYAQWHYPLENKKLVEQTFPADFIAEGIDQTRGWFYTLHVLATALTLKNLGLGKNTFSFQNVIVNGLILGEDGKKLSKRLKNYPQPEIVFEKYGADSLRYYLLASTAMGEDYILSEKRVAETMRRTVMTFWNSLVFWRTYTSGNSKAPNSVKPANLLDRWIVSRLQSLNKQIVEQMDNYDLTRSARLLDGFIDELSNWYIRRSRQRFQKPANKNDKKQAEKILAYLLLNFSKIAAPFLPFITEEVYQHLGRGQSVHLENYPRPKLDLIDEKLEEQMEQARSIVASALAQRAKAGIKVRQPLKGLTIGDKRIYQNKELVELIKQEVNIKEIALGKKLFLATKLTPELKSEGAMRELVRSIQQMRKEAGLNPGQEIYLRYWSETWLDNLIGKYSQEIKEQACLKQLEEGKRKKEKFLLDKEIEIEGRKIWLGIK